MSLRNINKASTLIELKDALSVYPSLPHSSAETLESIIEYVDLTKLPKFGGIPPKRFEEIWSWDSDNVLLYNGHEFYIEQRDPDAWYNR